MPNIYQLRPLDDPPVRPAKLPSGYVYLELRDELRQPDGTRAFADWRSIAKQMLIQSERPKKRA